MNRSSDDGQNQQARLSEIQRAVEMTEEGNPQKPGTGISLLLGKRKERVSHISTAPTAAVPFHQKKQEPEIACPVQGGLQEGGPKKGWVKRAVLQHFD